ncbi:hypothetical protein, conserved [Eimeria necatrix]|uniref:SET domain-containing protein n=1 Tax=Eimeria necatrix TaxID=51315 RepID=U6MVG7_9EIME|nr:hypothetical protein, conserved [Eimeria necatrix]CDJ65680.1 hypothetical protein, conserved [Eimeria necatrix]
MAFGQGPQQSHRRNRQKRGRHQQENQEQPEEEKQQTGSQEQQKRQQEDQQLHRRQQAHRLQQHRPELRLPKVHVEYLGPKKGKALVASEAIQTAEVIYTEDRPLLAVQHEFSRLCGLACENCLRFVGSLKDSIRHVLTKAGRHRSAAKLESLPDSFLQRAGLVLSSVVPCGEAHCEAVFCSQQCRQHARCETLHRMVCVEAREPNSWQLFLSHARRHHDGLVMAGLCVAHVVFEVIFKRRQFSEAVTPFLQFYSAPWESLAQSCPSQETTPIGLRAQTNPETETVEGRRALLKESLDLLSKALKPALRGAAAMPQERDLETLFQLDFYSKLMGTFALVCLDVEFPHPLNSRLLAFKWRSPVVHPLISSFQSQDSQLGALQLTEEALVRVPQKGLRDYLENVTAEDANAEHILGHLLQEVHEITRWNEADEACQVEVEDTEGSLEVGVLAADSAGTLRLPWRAPLLPFIGWGLFQLGSMTNHSCWPNAESDFPLSKPALEVRALRPIKNGEEVTVSYIDEALPLHERRQILQANYGFSCTCPRCVVEATEALLVLRKVPECLDDNRLNELVARRTGLPVAIVTEVREYARRLTKPQERSAEF